MVALPSQIGLLFPEGISIPGNSGMDFLIPGNPGRPGTTMNVPYCSDVTVTIVELSAANYTCRSYVHDS